MQKEAINFVIRNVMPLAFIRNNYICIINYILIVIYLMSRYSSSRRENKLGKQAFHSYNNLIKKL